MFLRFPFEMVFQQDSSYCFNRPVQDFGYYLELFVLLSWQICIDSFPLFQKFLKTPFYVLAKVLSTICKSVAAKWTLAFGAVMRGGSCFGGFGQIEHKRGSSGRWMNTNGMVGFGGNGSRVEQLIAGVVVWRNRYSDCDKCWKLLEKTAW